MSTQDIIIRLVIALIMSGIIGFDREFKNRPAGLRTHILVCIGATVIALVQTRIAENAYQMALENPEISSIFTYEQGRLIAQVISGIGFLGAGTIIVTKRFVSGLTTAASLWAVAGLGIAVGMGYIQVALSGFFLIVIVLMLLQRIIHIPISKRIEINYLNRETKEFINQYFTSKNIPIKDISFSVDMSLEDDIYKSVYTIDLPNKRNKYSEIVEDISNHENIIKVSIVDV